MELKCEKEAAEVVLVKEERACKDRSELEPIGSLASTRLQMHAMDRFI